MTLESSPDKKPLFSLSFAALGIVFGDIGTSPLYAFSQIMSHLEISTSNIYGLLSLIFWTLIIIISFKYLIIIFRADNDGEGGIMALSGVIKQKIKNPGAWLMFITFVGIGLIIGDGILTPAISILSAVEGLKPLSADLETYILPITVVILFFLFWGQRLGTGQIGVLFAPVMICWFITIGILGAIPILQNPNIMTAINPYYAVHFFIQEKQFSILTLGGIFLVITGGEALFADLGHFGKNPIRLVWFVVVLPSLILCYFGQGALLLTHPEYTVEAFYKLSPTWFLPYMIVLATVSTVVASQAIISAAFSILKQACLLHFIPRIKIIYTSKLEKGQVYIPFINFILAVGTITLVLIFKTTNNLAAAYGIAINLDMLITTFLVGIIAYYCWSWNSIKLAIFPLLFIIESAFFAGNIPKFLHGGWIPVFIAFLGIIIMHTWNRGFEKLRDLHHRDALMDELIIDELNEHKVTRNAGTGLYVVDPYDFEGGSLLHHLRINRIFSENMIFICVKTENKPKIPMENKYELTQKADGLYVLNIYYGFTESINLPDTLSEVFKHIQLPFHVHTNKLTYFVELISVETTDEKDMWHWQKDLFAIMLRNGAPEIQFYKLPYNQTVALGAYYRI